MCLPVGFWSFLAKISTTYVMGFGLYCLFSYVEKGFLGAISQTVPIIAVIVVLLLTGMCSCIGLNKHSTCAKIFSILLATVVLAVVILLSSLSAEYFDLKKNCAQLTKSNPSIEMFIDKTIDQRFNETQRILCSPQCPCSWKEEGQMQQKSKRKLTVDRLNGAKSALECRKYLQGLEFDEEKQQAVQLMMHLEHHECSGYCVKAPFYSVTDINKGKPKHNCFDVTRMLQKEQLSTIFLGMSVLIWATAIFIPATCCLLCQRKKEQPEEEFEGGEEEEEGETVDEGSEETEDLQTSKDKKEEEQEKKKPTDQKKND